MRGRTLTWRPPQRETEVATVKARRTKYVHCLPLMQRPPRRDTELAAVEGRFQVYHPKLPTPSPMLVLDTFLPGIGASRVKHHVTRKDACRIFMKICVMTHRGQATMMQICPSTVLRVLVQSQMMPTTASYCTMHRGKSMMITSHRGKAIVMSSHCGKAMMMISNVGKPC